MKVEADHLTVHRHPLSVLEVRRILLLHLDELRASLCAAAKIANRLKSPRAATIPPPSLPRATISTVALSRS